MIILDTNVVSESMKPKCDPAVLHWLDRQDVHTLHITSTVLAELLVGIAYLPTGKRKEALAEALETVLGRVFGPRILSFNEEAARSYAALMERTRLGGYAISLGDGQIAAVAVAHGFTVATRDTTPFVAAGVPVLNPWQE